MEITIPGGTIQLSGNAIKVDVTTTSGAMVGKSKYKIALKITSASLIGSPFIEEIAPDANLLSSFDISGLVDQPIDTVFQFPATGVSQSNPALERTITLNSGEIYSDTNGNRVETWNNDAVDIRVLKGKLRPYELAILNEQNKSFKTEYIDDGKFLTNLPSPMTVLPAQIVKLWWMNPYSEQTEASWKCRITGELDGDIDEFDITGDCTLYTEMGLVEFNVNPVFMGFGDTIAVGYKALSFKFWLISNGNPISEVREFTIDNAWHKKAHLFYYVNSYSVVDSSGLTGKYIEGLTTTSETAYRPVPDGSGTKVAGIKTISVTGQRTWSIDLGMKTRKEILALRDFLESKEIWMIDPDQPTRLIPVTIEAGDFSLYDSTKPVQQLTIKVTEAHI